MRSEYSLPSTGSPYGSGGVVTSGAELASAGSSPVHFPTLDEALAASASGDVVTASQGTHSVSTVVPAGVTLKGASREATLLTGLSPIGDVLTGSVDACICDMSIRVPTDATSSAISFSGAGALVVSNVKLLGQAAGLGYGICLSGAGGVLSATNIVGADGSGGTMIYAGPATVLTAHRITVSPSTTYAIGLDLHSTAEIDGIVVAGATVAGVAMNSGCDIKSSTGTFTCTDAVHLLSDNIKATVRLWDYDTTRYSVYVPPAISSPELFMVMCDLDPSTVSAGPAFMSGGSSAFVAFTRREGDRGLMISNELQCGRPTRPAEAVFCTGDSTTDGMVVLTSDGTATAGTDGGNITDVTANLMLPDDGLTATFQGVGADHCIYVGSMQENLAGKLQHYGWKVNQTARAIGGTLSLETWTGASWETIYWMTSGSADFLRYGDTIIRRANSEHIRFWFNGATPADKTIGGVTCKWVRLRILTALSSLPLLDHVKTSYTRYEINGGGLITKHGQAMNLRTLLIAGNVFSDSGATSTTLTIGTGANAWTHLLEECNLNGSGDDVYWQGPLPIGIFTAAPIRVYANLRITPAAGTTTDVDLIFKSAVNAVEGVLAYDGAGGLTPIPRSRAMAEGIDTVLPQVSTTVLDATGGPNNIQRVYLGQIRIQGYYEGDTLWVSLELDDDGTPNQDVTLVSLMLDYVEWTPGAPEFYG